MNRNWLQEDTYDVDDDEDYISASRIKTFRKCPMQYYLSYVQDLPEEKISKGYRELGTAVHETIEDVLEENPTMTEASLSSRFQREWSENHKENVLTDHEQDCLDCLNVASRYISKVQPDILGIEDEMSFGVSSVDSRFLGYSDLTTEDAIIDWKTGRMYGDGDGKKGDDQIRDNRIQAAVYGMGYKELYDREPPEHVTYVYLKAGKVRRVPLDDETWEIMKEGALDLVESIKSQSQVGPSADHFEARPGGICFWCGVENFCEASPTSYAQVDYEEVPF